MDKKHFHRHVALTPPPRHQTLHIWWCIRHSNY